MEYEYKLEMTWLPAERGYPLGLLHIVTKWYPVGSDIELAHLIESRFPNGDEPIEDRYYCENYYDDDFMDWHGDTVGAESREEKSREKEIRLEIYKGLYGKIFGYVSFDYFDSPIEDPQMMLDIELFCCQFGNTSVACAMSEVIPDIPDVQKELEDTDTVKFYLSLSGGIDNMYGFLTENNFIYQGELDA